VSASTDVPARTCRSEKCGAPVIWGISINGKRVILDAEPVGRGNLVLLRRSNAHDPWVLNLSNLSERAREAARSNDVSLYLDHHATCPDVTAWRST
jgi:hypothetical protein